MLLKVSTFPHFSGSIKIPSANPNKIEIPIKLNM